MPICEQSLEDRIENFEFCPEIYIYPTPRMYEPAKDFSLDDLEHTDELNVYVHVPFCTHFCSFCGYFKTIYNEKLQADFVDTLCKEIELRGKSFGDKIVKTLHFGGGTPSLLEPEQLAQIVKALQKINPDILETCVEVSIEATPESIDHDKFAGYRAAGINRVSMGVQSLVDTEVVLANRCVEKDRSTFQMLSDAFDSLRKIGFPDVVIDLMIGIEGQTVKTFEESVKLALTLRPETVQLYALGIMPQTALGRRKAIKLMPGEEIYECYEIGRRLFLEAGYRQDSHDRYTLHPVNGFLQGDFNIQGMSLIGLGGGARSYAKRVHYRNTYNSQNGRKALEEYMNNINSGSLSVESVIHLNDDELARQYAIGHIRNLDSEEFEHRFGIRFEDKFPDFHKETMRLNLVEKDGSLLKLTQKGLLFRDLLGRLLFSDKAKGLEAAYRS